MRAVQDCYETILQAGNRIQGRVEIEFTVAPDGSVQESQIVFNDMGSPEVAVCIRRLSMQWRFPEPNGGAATVNYPFIFTFSD